MCPGIEWWEVNEVQISGNKIEPQWPFLDTLMEYEYEDKMYRLYYQSFKVYELQHLTTQAIDVFQKIAHTIDRPINQWFTEMGVTLILTIDSICVR